MHLAEVPNRLSHLFKPNLPKSTATSNFVPGTFRGAAMFAMKPDDLYGAMCARESDALKKFDLVDEESQINKATTSLS